MEAGGLAGLEGQTDGVGVREGREGTQQTPRLEATLGVPGGLWSQRQQLSSSFQS